jgi:hypothetical protein
MKPKRSLSSNESAIAAQLIATNGASARELERMQKPGDQPFTGAAFPLNQDRRVPAREPVDPARRL